jgi:hypothetical protein
VVVVDGLVGCQRFLGPSLQAQYTNPPPPHAADFKKFQKNFLAVYLVMVMSDWMQVRGARHVHGCTVAVHCGVLWEWLCGYRWRWAGGCGRRVEALATTRSCTLQSGVLGVPRLCHWCGCGHSRHSAVLVWGVFCDGLKIMAGFLPPHRRHLAL